MKTARPDLDTQILSVVITVTRFWHTNFDYIFLILTYWDRAHCGCDRSAEDAYSSMAPDPTFAFVGGPCCPTLDIVIAFWIMIYVLHIVNFAILYTRSLPNTFVKYHDIIGPHPTNWLSLNFRSQIIIYLIGDWDFFKYKHIHVCTELGCKYLFFTKNIWKNKL